MMAAMFGWWCNDWLALAYNGSKYYTTPQNITVEVMFVSDSAESPKVNWNQCTLVGEVTHFVAPAKQPTIPLRGFK